MFSVALIGPDGVGKTTITRHLERSLSLRSKYVYMGINLEASNLMLPTTRLILEIKRAMGKKTDMAGPRDPSRSKVRPRGLIRRGLAGLKSILRLINLLAEECFRQCVVKWYLFRGYIVLLDRDFFLDYYAHDIATNVPRRSFTSWIHGLALRLFYRRPDVVILLDADSETMFARKGEGTVEYLEQKRREYSRLRDVVKHFELVDANRPLIQVTHDVRDHICDYYVARSGNKETE